MHKNAVTDTINKAITKAIKKAIENATENSDIYDANDGTDRVR